MNYVVRVAGDPSFGRCLSLRHNGINLVMGDNPLCLDSTKFRNQHKCIFGVNRCGDSWWSCLCLCFCLAFSFCDDHQILGMNRCGNSWWSWCWGKVVVQLGFLDPLIAQYWAFFLVCCYFVISCSVRENFYFHLICV